MQQYLAKKEKLDEEMVSFHNLHDYGTYHVHLAPSSLKKINVFLLGVLTKIIDYVSVHLERNMGFSSACKLFQ